MAIKYGLLLAAVLLGGCASIDSRIADDQAKFDSYPPAVQQKIRAGQVALGYTPEMVRMALGEPDRRYTRESSEGNFVIWAYHDSRPSFGLGLGVGSFGDFGSSRVGGGVGVSTGAYEADEKLRVIFKNQLVTAIEKNSAP